MLKLRPYQSQAISAVLEARKQGIRRMVVSLPTGAGKTVIFSELARLAKRKVLVLAHRSELLSQAQDKLARAGTTTLEWAEHQADPEAKIVIASIRSLRPERLQRLREMQFGLVVYDECHHAPADDNQRVLRQMGCFEAGWQGALVGFTATTNRADGIGLDAVFEKVVFSASLPDLVHEGYLAPLRGLRINTAEDLAHIGGSGDFAIEELAQAVDVTERNALVATSIRELARDRRTIVFCVTVRHATGLARALRGVGVPCGIVHGAQRPEKRAEVLALFRRGELQAVTNVAVLTEGFDDPGVSCVAMARPTRSDGLYAQCVGRGTRLAPGKKDCLVLDFVDLGDRSLTTLPSLFGLPQGLQLQNQEVTEVARHVGAIWSLIPQLELPPGEITLPEIARRARAFDPLSMEVDPEVRAISPHAWHTLGATGVVLHTRGRGRIRSFFVLRDGARVRVLEGDQERTTFRTMAQGVEAVDFEVRRKGQARSALPEAAWRSQPVPENLGPDLEAAGLLADTWEEALRAIHFHRYAPRYRFGAAHL